MIKVILSGKILKVIKINNDALRIYIKVGKRKCDNLPVIIRENFNHNKYLEKGKTISIKGTIEYYMEEVVIIAKQYELFQIKIKNKNVVIAEYKDIIHPIIIDNDPKLMRASICLIGKNLNERILIPLFVMDKNNKIDFIFSGEYIKKNRIIASIIKSKNNKVALSLTAFE